MKIIIPITFDQLWKSWLSFLIVFFSLIGILGIYIALTYDLIGIILACIGFIFSYILLWICWPEFSTKDFPIKNPFKLKGDFNASS